ncbi:MAG: hypothetical protein JSV33_01580 [bacterium]|nr:MAG: hypothetical protein JSV33_01580 [bacterium]
MRKLFTGLVAAVLAVALVAPAMATDSRVMALGGAGRYLEDDYNIFDWPGTLPSYTNLVWMNIHQAHFVRYDGWNSEVCPNIMYVWGPEDGPWGICDDYLNTLLGASYGLGEDNRFGTLAMFYYRHAGALNPLVGWGGMMDDGGPWPGWDVFGQGLYNKFTIMYGYAMNGLSIGLQFIRSDEYGSQEMMDTEDEIKTAYTTIAAGVRFDMGENMYADLAFDFNMAAQAGLEVYVAEFDGSDWDVWGYQVTEFGEIEHDASTMFGGKLRLFYEWSEEITLVPYFGFRMFDFSLKAEADEFNEGGVNIFPGPWGGHVGAKGMMLDFGLGTNITVNEDNLLVFAIEPFSYAKMEPSEVPEDFVGFDSAEGKILIMPRFILALESDLKDWLTFRVGAAKELAKMEYTMSDDGDDTKFTETAAPFDYFMGLGFHVGDFDIDCVINNRTPHQLGYWLTGNEYGGDSPIVYMLSGKYHF